MGAISSHLLLCLTQLFLIYLNFKMLTQVVTGTLVLFNKICFKDKPNSTLSKPHLSNRSFKIEILCLVEQFA